MSHLRLAGLQPVARADETQNDNGFTGATSARAERCGDADAQRPQAKRDDVIKGEGLAEQGDGEQGAEHRHQIDEDAGPAGPDQFDAAHVEYLRESGTGNSAA